MKLIFIGSGAFAVPSLESLERSRHETLAVFAQPDKPAGRGHTLRMPRTKASALTLGIPVHQPPKIRAPEAVALVRDLAAEIIIVVAYGQIIPPSILELPPRGIINVHASLLPAYRGAAPIHWAIAAGERETGVTTMLMDEGLDTGPILLSRRMPIGPHDTTATLEPRLAELGAVLLLETLDGLEEGSVAPQAQDDRLASRAPLIKKEDAKVDWAWRAERIDRWIRAFQPWPVAYAESTSGESGRVKLFRASVVEAVDPDPLPEAAAPGSILAIRGTAVHIACGEGTVLAIEEVQAPGKASMDAAAFARGRRLDPGAAFP